MATRTYLTSPIPYSRRYVPSMSRTRHSPIGTYGGNYTTSYKDSYTGGLSTASRPSYARNQYSSSLHSTSTYDPHKYSSRISRPSTLTPVSKARPLPAGPGPLDERGRKIDTYDALRGTKTRSESVSRLTNGPVRATHTTSFRTGTYSPSSVDSSSSLSRTKRTNSVHDLTNGLDSMGISPSLARSKNYGSYAELPSHRSSIDAKVEKERVDELFDSGGNKVSSSSKNNYSTSKKYENNKDESDSTLPHIKSVTASKQDDSPSPARKTSYASRQNSTNAMSSTLNHTSHVSQDSSLNSRGLVGLRNLGNTCFMASILQCLSNTRLLLDYCLNDDYRDDINKTTSSMKGALINAYAKLMKSMWKSASDTYVSPTDFKAQIQKYAPRFVGYNQQDAPEFLIYLLEGLHEDVNRVREKKKNIILDDDGEEKISASEKARETWKRYLERDNSKIVDMFVGQLKSALRCTKCGYTSNTFDPFWDLSLPIRKRSTDVSLQDCFEFFTQEEVLDGDEKPTCARCKERRKCTKSFSIQKFPKVLSIHLKRFSQETYLRSKLSTNVNFPLDNLDLTKFAAEKSAPVLYNLYAVSNHSGTPFSGHYTAYAKHPHSGDWHYFNDQRVTSATPSRVQSHEAYVLFYELASQSSRL